MTLDLGSKTGIADLIAGAEKDISCAFEIALYKIHPNPYQPRKTIDEKTLEILCGSIDAGTLLQPVVVRPHPDLDGEFILVAGQRRILAYEKLQRTEIEAVVRDMDKLTAALAASEENDVRDQVPPMELAEHYQRVMDDFNLTQRDLAKRLHRSEKVISDTIAMLKLPDFLKSAYDEAVITAPQAMAEIRRAHNIEPENIERAVADATSISFHQARDLHKRLMDTTTDGDSKSTESVGGCQSAQAHGENNADDPSGTGGSADSSFLPVDMLINDALSKADAKKPLPGSSLRLHEIIIETLSHKRDPETSARAIVWAMRSDKKIV